MYVKGTRTPNHLTVVLTNPVPLVMATFAFERSMQDENKKIPKVNFVRESFGNSSRFRLHQHTVLIEGGLPPL